MGSKAESKKVAGSRSAGTAADANIQITPYRNSYLIRGDITAGNAGLKDFATWNERLGAWYITRRRAYEYDTTTASHYLGDKSRTLKAEDPLARTKIIFGGRTQIECHLEVDTGAE